MADKAIAPTELTAASLEEVLALGKGIGADVVEREGTAPFVILPDHFGVRSLAPLLDAPRRLRSTASFNVMESFVDYVKRHAVPDQSVVFADVNDGRFEAIIDFHGSDNRPTNRAHRAVFKAHYSEEWQVWSAANGKQISQEAMIRFFEEHLADIQAPPGADMLELVGTLEGKRQVAFKSGRRLSDGTQQLIYVETDDAKAGQQGHLTIPSELWIAIPVFYKADAVPIKVFFRYRIETGGNATFKVDIHRIRQVRDDAFDKLIADVEGGVGSAVKLYEAQAPAAVDLDDDDD